MHNNIKKALVILLFLVFGTATPALASLGVGVGVGKIFVNQQLRPGQIYLLPPITVLNTGDQPSDYQVLIEHQEKQPQLIPDSKWFIFSPQTFHLNPKKVQMVKIILNLPVNAQPGDYFVYLEAQPVTITHNGITSVNIAAATKLYFTVIPSSLLAGIYYKVISFWSVAAPFPQIFVGVVIVGILLVLLKRFINIEIKLSRNSIPKWVIALSVIIFSLLYALLWLKIFHVI